MEIKKITDKQNLEVYKNFLRRSNLPADDLNVEQNHFFGFYEGISLIATGGIEVYGQFALLRSLAVEPNHRGTSLGKKMTDHLIEEARSKKLHSIYLLTETARNFFEKKGFTLVDRNEVPLEIKKSSEFSNVCPVSAAVLRLTLDK